MPVDAQFAMPAASWSTLAGFLCVSARVGSVLLLVPFPGARTAPTIVKIVLILSVSFAAYHLVARDFRPPQDPLLFLGLLAAEAALGAAAGVMVGLLNELFVLATQSLSMQAGFAFASSIDPNTEADSGILLIVAQLFANLLFFSCNLHLLLFHAFASSLQQHPPGSLLLEPADAKLVIAAGSALFELALRLALPVIGLLLLTDISLALVGRIQPTLQLLTLLFPVKLLGAVAMLILLAPLWARLYEGAAAGTLARIHALLR